jgi:hypothetical protein
MLGTLKRVTNTYLQFIHALPLFNGFAIARATAVCFGVSAIIDTVEMRQRASKRLKRKIVERKSVHFIVPVAQYSVDEPRKLFLRWGNRGSTLTSDKMGISPDRHVHRGLPGPATMDSLLPFIQVFIYTNGPPLLLSIHRPLYLIPGGFLSILLRIYTDCNITTPPTRLGILIASAGQSLCFALPAPDQG